MRSAFALLALSLAFAFGCGGSQPADRSSLATSRDARALLGSPREIPEVLYSSIDEDRFRLDLPYQRQMLWSIWSFLFTEYRTEAGPKLDHWQSWYAIEDLQQIFRHLYEKLGKQGRKNRADFTAPMLAEALIWHSTKQFASPSWDVERWSRWLDLHQREDQRRAIPGMNKILMNRPALLFILNSYKALARCYRETDSCEVGELPAGSALLKTAWRRSGDGFSVALYPTHDLLPQLAADQWTSRADTQPKAEEAYTIHSLSGQTFHLVGMHLMLKWQQKKEWIWSSLWYGDDEGARDLAADRPSEFRFPRYRLCSLGSMDDDWAHVAANSWPDAIQNFREDLVKAQLSNWCSNPYLEIGPSNQKTNCAGCHQHAGKLWNNQEFTRRLKEDLPSLLQRSGDPGPLDQIWSLTTGPSALAAIIVDTIDYFDVYDPYLQEEENEN